MRHFITYFTFISLAVLPIAQAQNIGLLLAPTQVIFAPNQTVQTLTATNRAGKPVVQKVYLSEEVMGPNGSVSTLKEGEFPYSVRRLVRFSPDTIELAPGESQVIRVMVRRPANLEAGDYHSHLILEEQPPAKVLTDSSTTPFEGTNKAGFAVQTLLTLGVPIIVQHGAISSSLDLIGLKPWPRTLPNGNPAPFEVQLKRSGNATGVGFLTLQTPKAEDIMVRRRVSVYREVDEVTLKIQPTELGLTYKGPATLRLTNSSAPDAALIEAQDVQIK
jgi:hypothetical protein